MAVDSVLYPEATNLAKTDKAFYPVRIPVSHWQLRHYISTPERDLLYYASGNDIYCLNTATKKRKHIARLPFEARCTASGYGWVCVGGEELGHFAAIKLDGSGQRSMDVDAALPIDAWRQDGGRRAASVKVERMGDDIVNSISIHRIQDEEAHLDDIVAVLTNNDKTVRMYSLPSNLETMVLDLPFPVNHATVSPDGQTLVAVGDDNQAYFYQREILATPPQIHKPHNRLTSGSIDWTCMAIINLHVSGPDTSTGYFTTAWAPNGHLVAVGSEGGYITVFDINLLTDPDLLDQEAVVAIVPGSRPDIMNPHPGAVRSMMFSPDPWDLLIWAEGLDRICIGDLRTGLKSRQIVKLDPKEEGLRQIPVEDVPADEVLTLSAPPPPPHTRDLDELEADFIRRYRQAPESASTVNFATEYIEVRRRARQHRQDRSNLVAELERMEAGHFPQGLTPSEQQILDSLRTSRQREEARANGGVARSVNYTTSDMFRQAGSNRSSTATLNRTEEDLSTRPRSSEIMSSVQDSFPELSRTQAASPRPGSSYGTESQIALPSLSSLQDGVWGSAAQRAGTASLRQIRLPPLPTPPGTNSSSGSASANPNPTASSAAERPQPASATEEEENPWRTIEEHMTLARGPLFESAQRAAANSNTASPLPASTSTSSTRPAEADFQAELHAERQRARSLARQRERWRMLNAARESSAAASTAPPTTNTAQQEGLAARMQNVQNLAQGGDILLRRAMRTGGYLGREVGVRTAGLAMSPDGRTLWAACEEGIFEIEICVKGRMFWGAVEPR